MISNQASWLPAKYIPLEVRPATYNAPGVNEIVVKNAAVAINPLDSFKQDAGDLMFSWIKYPFIMGNDLAGEVVEVRKSVTRFKVGERVLGHAEYTMLRTNLVSPIPDSISYESACVLPLGMSTAACGFFMEDFLALPFPTLSPKPAGETLLVWGGSSSVGCNAIQLVTAAGHEVITTASPKNHNYLQKLSAVETYDYRSPTVIRDIIAAFKNRTSAGGFAIGNGSMISCIEILAACKGRKFYVGATNCTFNSARCLENISAKSFCFFATEDNFLTRSKSDLGLTGTEYRDVITTYETDNRDNFQR